LQEMLPVQAVPLQPAVVLYVREVVSAHLVVLTMLFRAGLAATPEAVVLSSGCRCFACYQTGATRCQTTADGGRLQGS